MDLLKWILFESSVALGVLCGLALFALLVHWRRRLRPRPLLIGLAVTVALFIAQATVVTDRERVFEIMRPIERAIVAGRVEPLGRALSPRFVAGERDREEFLDYVERQFDRGEVHSVRLRDVQVEQSESGRFTAILRYSADVEMREHKGYLPTAWLIRFVREEEGWRIEAIEPRRIGLMQVGDWEQFDRL